MKAEKKDKVSEICERLQLAVKCAGGPSKVSREANIPLASLNHYLLGRKFDALTAVDLSKATGVSLEWLCTGCGNGPGASLATPVGPYIRRIFALAQECSVDPIELLDALEKLNLKVETFPARESVDQ